MIHDFINVGLSQIKVYWLCTQFCRCYRRWNIRLVSSTHSVRHPKQGFAVTWLHNPAALST
jgi:hypothetical protein